MVPPLYHLKEKSRTVLNWFAEYLQQISIFIMIDQDLVLLKHIDILSYLNSHIWQVISHDVVISIRNCQELNPSFHQCSHSFNDSLSPQSDVLCSWSMIVIHKLLHLRLLLGYRWLSYWNLDVFIVISHDDGSKGRVFSVNDLVVSRPEAMQVHDLFVVLNDRLHLEVGLIADHVVYLLELDGWQNFVELLSQVVRLVAGQEQSCVPGTFNKRMDHITVSLDGREDHSSILIREFIRGSDRYRSIGNGVLIYGSGVLNSEGNVLDSIAMLNQMLVHFFRGIPLVNRAEDKGSPSVVPYHMAGDSPLPSLQPLIGQILEAKPGSIEGGSLFGIPNPKCDMIQLQNIVPVPKILPKEGSVVCTFSNIQINL